MTLTVCPLTFREAATFVQTHHRHHPPPAGHKFSIGVCRGNQIVGVAMIGRPVARHYDDGLTLEVNRTCTDGTPNANSMLYGAAWRAAKAMGYRRLITYTRADESGSSLKGAGFKVIAQRNSRPGWNCPSRPRVETTETHIQRTLWEASVNGSPRINPGDFKLRQHPIPTREEASNV